MRKAIVVVLAALTLGIGFVVAVRRGWFEGLEVFKPIEIYTN